MKNGRMTHGLMIFILIFILSSSMTTSEATPFLNLVGNAQAQGICFTLRDQDTHQISGVINSYYPGTANASAGATTISVGPGQGAGQSIQSGDLLLVIQMQDATIDSSNTSAYGSGGTNGSGYTDPGNSGRYEFVVAASGVDYAAGGTLSITGAGTGNSLLYSYTNANGSTTSGQRRFQVVLVPAYLNADLTGDLSASPWNGATGGVFALEVVNSLSFNGYAINVNEAGFRGGGGRQLGGSSSTANTDYRNRSTRNAHGSKGEGIAGTPRYVFFGGAVVNTNPPAGDGYPSGSQARGAPGNAGGGGSDGHPSANDENSGGGGGGNGGAGGQGGYSWRSALDVGGRGGAAFAEVAPGRLVLGGGGGAGTTNNGTGTPGSGAASSGAAGGGVVILRLGGVGGTGSVSANGGTSLDVLNDSTGGGGAGGSIVAVSPDLTAFNALTFSAIGGNGGLAWPLQPPGGYPGERHGPGGGGGGGVIYLSGSAASTDVSGGLNGTTTNVNDAYGALPGAEGIVGSASVSDIPGVPAGFECYTPTAINLTDFRAGSSPLPVSPFLLALSGVSLLFAPFWMLQQRWSSDPLPLSKPRAARFTVFPARQIRRQK